MPHDLTKSQLNRIGERLRKNTATEEDVRRLDEYRISFMPAFHKVYDELTAMGLRPGGRPQKTTPSIVAKLNREKTRLSTMQDIAGCRVEVPDRFEQDRVTIKLTMRYPDAETQDRRIKPSHGYRAVHVIVTVEGKPVEIQVRTELQHHWALVTEKLSDIIDRRIKYGGGPADIQELLGEISQRVAILEQQEFLQGNISEGYRRGELTLEDVETELLEREDGTALVALIRAEGDLDRWLHRVEQILTDTRRELNRLLKAILDRYSIVVGDKR
jgi:putative GTP pyrophosphokinase